MVRPSPLVSAHETPASARVFRALRKFWVAERPTGFNHVMAALVGSIADDSDTGQLRPLDEVGG